MTTVDRRFRRLVLAAAVVTSAASTTGCLFEMCCMRPVTGAYDVCFHVAAPQKAIPLPDDVAPAPRAEVALPAARAAGALLH